MPPKILFLAPILLLAALAACGETEELTPNPSATVGTATPAVSPTATLAETPTPSPHMTPVPTAPADWKTYQDAKFDFSFRYPPDWYLSPPGPGRDAILYSYDPETAPGIGGISEDRLKAFWWVAEGVDQPLEQWLAEYNGPPPTPAILSTSDIELAGKSGLRVLTDYNGQRSVSYYVKLGGGRVFVINVIPADSKLWADFESVLASLDFSATP